MILRSVRIGDNGWYDPVDGSIHIDLYAGADGKGTMLFTAAHELTHFIKDQSPEKFQALSDFLMEQYGKKGVPVQALVEEQMAKARKHGNALDPDGAFEEVVADSMESMLTDGKVLQELKQRDKGLWQTVKDYVLELCEKIRKVYKRLKPDSLEGRMVAEMKDAAEEMRRLFVEGLQDAAENFTGGEAQKNTTLEGGVKHSIRETTDGRFVAVVDNDILSSIDTSHWNKETKNAAQKAAVNALKQFREGIVVDGITRKVNKISVREFTRSKGTEALFKNRPDIFADKMRTSDILDDVIVASTDWSRDGGLKHPRADNFEDFDHGKILIQAGNNRYSAEVVVGITSNGDAVFYDVVNMVPVEFEVKRRNPPTATTQKAIGDMLEGSSEGRIAQETEEVKKKFSMREPVDAGENFRGAEESTTREGDVKHQARRLSEADLSEYLLAGGRTNKKKINASNSGEKIILTSQQEIVNYIDKAIDKQLDNNITVAYGKVNDRLANGVLIASDGRIKIKDNFLELIPDNLQHAYEQHNSAKREGDIDLSREDFERIPEYLDSFTEVVYAITYSSGKTSVCVSKKLPNGRMLLIEVVSKSRGALQFKNAIGVSEEKYQTDYVDVYKKRAESNTRGSIRSNNSLHDDISSDNSIFNSEEIVKQKFSLRDQDVRKMNDVLEKQNKKLREDVASLKELLKLQKSVTGGKLLNQNSLDTAAGYLMRSSGAKGNKAELSGLLKDVYSYIAGDEAVTWDEIMERAEGAASWLEEHMEQKQRRDPYADDVLREIRGSRITLDESQKAGAEYQFGIPNCHRLMQW